ncbi:MAG: permease prefix domain 1-containing protein [Planctomycetota bacterium]|nr:permease prefix domain 1-containing protein [Planctomycetota bacterium]
MFNLNDEVLAWCQSAVPACVERHERVAELVDHVLCQVEAHMGDGSSEEEAFHAAIQRMGDSKHLAEESQKEQTWNQRQKGILLALCTGNVGALRRTLRPKEGAAWIIGVSLVFAAAMILTDSWADSRGMGHAVTMTWIAVWFVPYSLLSMATVGVKGTMCETEE